MSRHHPCRFLPLFAACLILSGVPAVPAEAQDRVPADPGLDYPWTGEPIAPLTKYAVSAALGRREPGFHGKSHPEGCQIRNPVQDYGAVFSDQGARIVREGLTWNLGVRGFGYGEVTETTAAVRPRWRENRVEYARGALLEWFVNGPGGLQHGITVARPPRGPGGESRALSLAIPLDRSASVSLDPDRAGLTWHGNDGRAVFRYRGLVALDADGRKLPAWMEIHGNELRLCVDDTGAAYPLLVDPFIETVKLLEPQGTTGDRFGLAVAVSNNTLVVGSRTLKTGALYVFEKPPTGAWKNATLVATLTRATPLSLDEFGRWVAVDGDTIAAGAPCDFSFFPNPPAGNAVYVYAKPTGGWKNMTETARLLPGIPSISADFGGPVAVQGNTVVAGRWQNYGHVYLYERPVGGWSTMYPTATLTMTRANAVPTQNGTYPRRSVAMQGDTVVVGVPLSALNYNVIGAAFVFEKPQGGWRDVNETAMLTASDGAGGDAFGASVALDGNTVVVGAPQYHYSAAGPGKVYVFTKPATGWRDATETARLEPAGGTTGDRFGYSLSLDGDLLVVGASDCQVNNQAAQGAVYFFTRPPYGWVNARSAERLVAADGAAGDMFGISVALGTDVLAIGAVGDDSSKGSAYLATAVRPTAGDLLLADRGAWKGTAFLPLSGSTTPPLTTLAASAQSGAFVSALANGPDNRSLAWIESGSVHCLRTGNRHGYGTTLTRLPTTGAAFGLVWDSDGGILVAGTDNLVYRYDPITGAGTTLTRLPAQAGTAAALALDDDTGRMVFGMSGTGVLLEYDPGTYSLRTMATGAGPTVTAVDHDQIRGWFYVTRQEAPELVAVDARVPGGKIVASTRHALPGAIKVLDTEDSVFCTGRVASGATVTEYDRMLTVARKTWGPFPGFDFTAMDVLGHRKIHGLGAFQGTAKVPVQRGSVYKVRGQFDHPGSRNQSYAAALSFGLRPGLRVGTSTPGCNSRLNLNISHPLFLLTGSGLLEGIWTSGFLGTTGSDGEFEATFDLPSRVPGPYTLHFSAAVVNSSLCSGLDIAESIPITVP